MKKRWADYTVYIVLFLLAVSCATVAMTAFSLESAKPAEKESVISIVKGTVNYGKGLYLPSEASTLEISLLMKDQAETWTKELARQRIRNVQKFPFQFSIRFDEAEMVPGSKYIVVLNFTNDGSTYTYAETPFQDDYPPDNISLTLN